MEKELLERFPALRGLEASALRTLTDSARFVSLPPGAKAFEASTPCDNYLMMARGCIRVQQISESGREIVLYRVSGGETCVLTTACLLTHESYSAEAAAETQVSGLIVPRSSFDRLIAGSRPFRDFVFTAYASRITDLMLLIQEVAFGHIDIRLAQRLLDLRDSAGTVPLTHQELAVELGTAREVVSRQLKEFERRGWIRLVRGSLEVLDDNALNALVDDTRL